MSPTLCSKVSLSEPNTTCVHVCSKLKSDRVCVFVVGPLLPTSTSRPPDIIYERVRPGLLRLSPFFHIRVLYCMQNKKRGRPGSEATFNLYHGVCVDERCWSKCTTVMYVVVNFKK